MPTGISSLAPFDYDSKGVPAFTIIHRDNLQTTLPILHFNQMNGYDEDENNDLTRLKNHKNNLYTRKRISRSNDHLALASLQNNQTNPLQTKKKQQSKSHDNLLNQQDEKKLVNISTEDFNDILNAKLRKIQELEEHETGKKGSKKLPQNSQKKPFITTVKCGEFLMPPPEVAALLGMAPNGAWIGNNFGNELGNNFNQDQHHQEGISRSRFRPLISLDRRPEVRHNSHNARCPAALKATIDFAINNGEINSSLGIATTATTLANEERLKRTPNNRFASVATGLNQMIRAIPNKLKPIKGPVPTINSGDHHSLPFGNIMFDRRVVRGSTFASNPMLIDGEQSQAARHAEARRKELARKRNQQQASRSMMLRIRSPPPVAGRKHEPVQTELYLEELFEKPAESEVGTQTDYFLDRPITPPYCPAKTGTDAETQIDPGDLFDYDTEVQPILEVLVGKTIEQALIEVLEEEELAALKEQQRRFLELRAAEKVEVQRLEEQERRLREEKDRRLKQHEEAVKTQQETEERVAAAVLLTGYIAELLPAVLEGLKMSGFLLDEIKSDVEEGFMPWLMKEVKKEMGTVIQSRELLMEIIKEILENRADTYRQLGEKYDSSRELTTARFDSEEFEESGGTRDNDFANYQSPDAL